MKGSFKRVVSWLMVLCMVLSFVPAASAHEPGREAITQKNDMDLTGSLGQESDSQLLTLGKRMIGTIRSVLTEWIAAVSGKRQTDSAEPMSAADTADELIYVDVHLPAAGTNGLLAVFYDQDKLALEAVEENMDILAWRDNGGSIAIAVAQAQTLSMETVLARLRFRPVGSGETSIRIVTDELSNASSDAEEIISVTLPGPAVVAEGWSGYTTWILTADGTITFSGQGNMKNYEYSGGQPWADYADLIQKVVIDEGVAAIGSCAFMNCTALEEIVLPQSGLVRIGEAAFYGCSSLKKLYIPDGIFTIWAYTFKNCTALTSVRLPATLIKVDQGAFEGYTGLEELFVPGDTEIVGAWSFKGCTGLRAVDMQWVDATEIREGAFKNCTSLRDIILPGDIRILGDSAFYGIGARTFCIPETVTEVRDWCFARCAVQEFTFAGDAPAIGEGAFNKITAVVRYPAGNATWTGAVRQNYGGTITWMPN